MSKIEIIPNKKSKYSAEKIMAVILFISAALIWIPIPIPDKESIAALLCVIMAVYLLLVKKN